MELRDHIIRETSALADRLLASAEGVIADVRREADEAIRQLRGELERTLAELEAETSRAAARAAELETTNAALGEANDARLRAEAAVSANAGELAGLRELLESARAEAARLADALDVEAAQKVLLQQTHEAAVRDFEAQLDKAVAEARVLDVSFAEAEKRTREAMAASEAEARRLRQQVEEQARAIQAREARLETADAAVLSMRAEVDEANAIADAAGAEMTALRDRARRTAAMLNAAQAALASLDGATTVADLCGRLVRQLARDFERVAVFRVKGNHLEGDMASGLDEPVDITKIVIPMGLGSLITRAAGSGSLESATGEQMAEVRPPFGGLPASALAARLVLEGEVIAVAYADADTPFSDAHGPLAGVMIRHANAVLARLAEAQKSERHLREYARALLHDAEAMFVADTAAGLPPHDRLGRLRDSMEYARDLYAHRADMEGTPAPGILEEEIAAAAGAEPSSPFATALASIARERTAQRSAS